MLNLDTASASQTLTSPSLEEARQYLEQLDLEYIIKKLSYNPKVTGWTKKEAERCSKMYKNVLFLFKKYPDQSIIPSQPVDEFWHEHILFTRHYHEDCIKIFGTYRHHDPGDISRKQDIEHFEKVFQEVTQKIYFTEYGEYL